MLGEAQGVQPCFAPWVLPGLGVGLSACGLPLKAPTLIKEEELRKPIFLSN